MKVTVRPVTCQLLEPMPGIAWVPLRGATSSRSCSRKSWHCVWVSGAPNQDEGMTGASLAAELFCKASHFITNRFSIWGDSELAATRAENALTVSSLQCDNNTLCPRGRLSAVFPSNSKCVFATNLVWDIGEPWGWAVFRTGGNRDRTPGSHSFHFLQKAILSVSLIEDFQDLNENIPILWDVLGGIMEDCEIF